MYTCIFTDHSIKVATSVLHSVINEMKVDSTFPLIKQEKRCGIFSSENLHLQNFRTRPANSPTLNIHEYLILVGKMKAKKETIDQEFTLTKNFFGTLLFIYSNSGN